MNGKKNVKFFNIQQAKQIYHFKIIKKMLYKKRVNIFVLLLV